MFDGPRTCTGVLPREVTLFDGPRLTLRSHSLMDLIPQRSHCLMGLTRIVSFASTDFLGFLHSLWSSSGFGGGFGTVLHSLVLGVVLGLWCLVVSGGIMVARVWTSLGLLFLPGSLSRFLFEICRIL